MCNVLDVHDELIGSTDGGHWARGMVFDGVSDACVSGGWVVAADVAVVWQRRSSVKTRCTVVGPGGAFFVVDNDFASSGR